MRYIKLVDGRQDRGYLEVHETIRGFMCFICTDEPKFFRLGLTKDNMAELQMLWPDDYVHELFKTRELAEKMLRRIAMENGFTELEDNI